MQMESQRTFQPNGVTKKDLTSFFFFLEAQYIDTHIGTSTHPYKYMHAHLTHMTISERLNRFDLEIREVDHQERIAVDIDVAPTE
jgi:hypothetical protein